MKHLIPAPAMWLFRRSRRWLHEMQGKDVPTRVHRRPGSVRIGSEYGGWEVLPSLLNRDSIVYSFGVGHDISFDLGLIERFGTTVHAFDPTPAVAEFIRKTNPPGQFVFHPTGLAGHDGELRFEFNQGEQLTVSQSTQGQVVLPVKRLSTLLRELGHTRLDLLKVDIEGSEIQFLDDLVANPVEIDQLLIEFHHGPAQPDEVRAVRRALGQIGDLGFELFDRTAVGREFSYVHQRKAKG
jgi:FkbM family methyltransferase